MGYSPAQAVPGAKSPCCLNLCDPNCARVENGRQQSMQTCLKDSIWGANGLPIETYGSFIADIKTLRVLLAIIRGLGSTANASSETLSVCSIFEQSDCATLKLCDTAVSQFLGPSRLFVLAAANASITILVSMLNDTRKHADSRSVDKSCWVWQLEFA